jgi:DNA-binding FadR family transcriptional regulator
MLTIEAAGGGRNLTYALLEAVGKSIVAGRFDSNPFPTEADLAKQYAVSRSVTREAVKMLTAKGLLAARPRKGTTVQPSRAWNLFDPDVLRWMMERNFSLELLRYFNELRHAIEPMAAALAAQSATPEGIARVKAAYQRMLDAETGRDEPLEADTAFHIAILEASNNPFYAQLGDMVSIALKTSIRFTNRVKGASSLEEHRAVLAAIEARDPEAARAAMTALIDSVFALLADAQAVS